MWPPSPFLLHTPAEQASGQKLRLFIGDSNDNYTVQFYRRRNAYDRSGTVKGLIMETESNAGITNDMIRKKMKGKNPKAW